MLGALAWSSIARPSPRGLHRLPLAAAHAPWPIHDEWAWSSALWGHEYSLDHLLPALAEKIQAGHLEQFIFLWNGRSCVVSDMVKDFFITQHIPIEVTVINDYDTEWLVSDAEPTHAKTLVCIVGYAGWPEEPCLFYARMQGLNGADKLLILRGGGRIAPMAKEDGNAVVEYRMRHADREYPINPPIRCTAPVISSHRCALQSIWTMQPRLVLAGATGLGTSGIR